MSLSSFNSRHLRFLIYPVKTKSVVEYEHELFYLFVRVQIELFLSDACRRFPTLYQNSLENHLDNIVTSTFSLL